MKTSTSLYDYASILSGDEVIEYIFSPLGINGILKWLIWIFIFNVFAYSMFLLIKGGSANCVINYQVVPFEQCKKVTTYFLLGINTFLLLTTFFSNTGIEYILTNKKIIISKNVNKRIQIPFDEIKSIEVRNDLFGKIFNTKHIVIILQNGQINELNNVKGYDLVVKKIEDNIKK